MRLDHPHLRRLSTVAALGFFAILGAATAGGEEDEEGATASAASGEQTSAGLQALEAHLAARENYAEGPDAAMIAEAAREALAPGDALAVRVVPGVPRKIVVLVRYASSGGYENLRDIPSSERNEELDRIVAAIDDAYEAGADELGVAIRGAVFYGAIAVRHPSQPIEYHTGAVISTSVLDPLLTAEPGPEARPTLEVGSRAEGTLAPHPMPQPAYALTLSEARRVRVRLTSNVTGDDSPIAIVCRGTVRAGSCAEDASLEPLEELDDATMDDLERAGGEAEEAGLSFQEDVYDMPAGQFTVIVFRNDCEAEGGCPGDRASYTVQLL
jgi:hypothetical protein